MSRDKYSARRQDIIHKQSDKLNRQIDRAQNGLLKYLTDIFIPSLPTGPDGQLVYDDQSIFLPSKLDNAYDVFASDYVKPIISGFADNTRKLIMANKGYFATFGEADDQAIEDKVFAGLGLSGAVVAGGSLLYNILSDREAVGSIKSVIMSSITAGLTITGLRIAVENLVLRKDGGLIKNLFEKTIPEPYVKIDRFIGKEYATALELNFAIYQGGTIKTSRDFCIERNNKVFSREEIMRFGTSADKFDGYTDKAKGEFQGKNANYDPLQDLGGYNCRHSYDWVSDELAYYLRPELKGRS